MIKKHTESNLLFLHRIFKGIANATIEFFIPLIIYNQTGNLIYAFTFSLIKCFCCATLFLLAKKFMRKNAILSVLISIIPIIIAEFLLNLQIKLYVIIILAILAGASETLYYGAINLIFSVMDKSANSAKFDIGYNIGQIFFTILSAYILGGVKNSLIFVVIFATIMHITCIVPLIVNYKKLNSLIKNIPHNNQKNVLIANKYFNLYHYFFGIGYVFIEVALPLYLAVNGLSFTAVGIFIAASQIIKIIASIFAKIMQNREKDILCIIINVSIFFSSLIAILFVKNSTAIYILNLFITFACQSLQTIIFVKYVKSGVKSGYIYDSIYYRDFFQNSGRATTMLLYIITSMFPVLFGVGIFASALTGFLGVKALKDIETKNEQKYINLQDTQSENIT